MGTYMSTSRRLENCSAFAGQRHIATGTLEQVALKAKSFLESHPNTSLLFFDDERGSEFDLNLRGSDAEVKDRLLEQFPDSQSLEAENQQSSSPRVGPGRPRLNVVPREVTLLPRHWRWLNDRPGSASAQLRSLIDEAQHRNRDTDRRKRAQKSVFVFISALAGNNVNFEEAVRALFGGEKAQFSALIESWPDDVRQHALRLSEEAFQPEA